MKNTIIRQKRILINFYKKAIQYAQVWIIEKRWNIATIFCLLFIFTQKDVALTVEVDKTPFAAMSASLTPRLQQNITITREKNTTSIQSPKLTADVPDELWAYVIDENTNRPKAVKIDWKEVDNYANTYSNLTYTHPQFMTENTSPQLLAKRKKQIAYIQRFSKIAKQEMKNFGIPASITLAQGLLESNVGESKLATRNNNHFGMKCFSKKCGKGHCSNFTDDSHKDFFRIYSSPWESYRAHSIMLGGKRYRNLKKLGTKNYRDWAKGLKKAGYATDKKYAEKLINLIDELALHQFDR